eukprot:jgi/Hompol1/2547/HPOL_006060-RA
MIQWPATPKASPSVLPGQIRASVDIDSTAAQQYVTLVGPYDHSHISLKPSESSHLSNLSNQQARITTYQTRLACLLERVTRFNQIIDPKLSQDDIERARWAIDYDILLLLEQMPPDWRKVQPSYNFDMTAATTKSFELLSGRKLELGSEKQDGSDSHLGWRVCHVLAGIQFTRAFLHAPRIRSPEPAPQDIAQRFKERFKGILEHDSLLPLQQLPSREYILSSQHVCIESLMVSYEVLLKFAVHNKLFLEVYFGNTIYVMIMGMLMAEAVQGGVVDRIAGIKWIQVSINLLEFLANVEPIAQQYLLKLRARVSMLTQEIQT